MALQTASPPTTPSAQVVGNAFVEQYYHILHHSPELVYRFYQDESILSRPDSNGSMTSVTTMQGINEKILSFDYKGYKAEIKTADAQSSYKRGVIVLVTGCLSKNNLKRKFAQSFFLAPQDNGYFVLNDVFRYVEDGELLENHQVDGVNGAAAITITSDPEPAHVPDSPASDTPEEADPNVVEKSYDASYHEKQLGNPKEPVAEPPPHSHVQHGNDVSSVVETTSTTIEEDAPKKSYASIVKVAKGSPGLTKVYVPTNTAKVAPKKTENQSVESAAPSSVPDVPTTENADSTEFSNASDEDVGHSIYIRNLPFNVTTTEIEAEFKKFGAIKQGGIQVRHNKQQGYCFGFVEFLSFSSMNNAIQASPVTIRACEVVVEIKRTTTRVGSGGRGRFPPGRGGFRSDSFRVRGSYGGGRGYNRVEHGNRGEFSGRGRGVAGRGGDGYQQGRRSGQPSVENQNTDSA